MLKENKFAYRLSADEMFLNNSFQHGRRTRVIPNSVRIHDSNGTVAANSHAVRLGPRDTAVLAEAKLLQAAFEKVPRLKSDGRLTTFGF